MHSAKECILQTQIFPRLHAYAFLTPTANNNFRQSRVPRLTRQKNITPPEDRKAHDIDSIFLSAINFIKIMIFREVMPCSLVYRHQYFQEISSLHL